MNTDIQTLIEDYGRRGYQRDLRRFACYCARQTAIDDEQLCIVLVTAQRYSDDLLAPIKLLNVRESMDARIRATRRNSVNITTPQDFVFCAVRGSVHPNAWSGALESAENALNWARVMSEMDNTSSETTPTTVDTRYGSTEMEATLWAYLVSQFPVEPLPFVPRLSIGRDKARQIAQAALDLERKETVDLIREVKHVRDPGFGAPNPYTYEQVYLDFCWIAYVELPECIIQSSVIVLVCALTGKVLFIGSAMDEG